MPKIIFFPQTNFLFPTVAVLTSLFETNLDVCSRLTQTIRDIGILAALAKSIKI